MKLNELVAAHKYAEVAERLASETSPKGRAQRAYALTYLQRDEEAAELIHDLPFDGLAAKAHSNLATHFASRQELVKRIGVDDPVGAKWAPFYANHPDFKVKCRLSVTLIVKNEAKHIGRCIKSVLDVADEIVLVDTGSTDGTVDLAKQAAGETVPLTVGEFAWCDDFSAARNEALRLASGDWALWIDADEELVADGIGEIRQALIRPQYGGFHVRIVNFTGEEGDDSAYTHTPVRLFRRLEGVSFYGRIHEQVSDTIEALKLPIGTLETATLLHYGYRPSEMSAKNKLDRFLTMLEREVRDNPADAFQWFNLANAYVVAGRNSEAEHAARTAVRLGDSTLPTTDLSYQLLATALIGQGKAQAALDAIDEAESRGIGGMYCGFERANAYINLGRLDEALESIDESLTHQWKNHQTGDLTLHSYKRHLVKGQILAMMGRNDEALELFEYSLGVNPEATNAVYLKAATLTNLGRLDEALPDFRKASNDPVYKAASLTGIGRIYSAMGQHKAASAAFEEAWKLDPSNYDSWATWAASCEASGDLDSVVRVYSAFAQTNEPTAEILINWGRALDRAGQSQRALDLFSEVLQRDPEDANGYFNAGDLLYRHGHYQDAAHLYQGGLRLRPDYPEGWFVLGNSLAQIGILDGARTAYHEALKLRSDYQEVRTNLEVIGEVAAA